MAKAVDEFRERTTQMAKALQEQAQGGSHLEAASRLVAKLAEEVTVATGVQAIATAGLAKTAEEVRRLAKQTSRALEEQATTVAATAANVARQTLNLGATARATTQQAVASEEILRSVDEMRRRARAVVSARLASNALGSNGGGAAPKRS
jgi:methyl-accepting chemotaxis protein